MKYSKYLFILIFVVINTAVFAQEKNMKYNKLTAEEEKVILHKGTEQPFSGIYDNHDKKGTYICKRCDAALYLSESKFDAGCGWPSFDDEIPEAVKHLPDADGNRTEIVCSNCGAHLGHVFTGEGFTETNIRHCVNSISMNFLPAEKKVATQTAYFAGGCFWGVEYYFQKNDAVLSTAVGYMGGDKKNPTYSEVCAGNTGFAETIEVVFDPAKTSFEKMAILFFETHDPTQINRQGPDIGQQYRSEIFYLNDEQKNTAEKLIKILEKKSYKIATQLTKAEKFWPAEKYHQDYYLKNGQLPYCHVYQKKF